MKTNAPEKLYITNDEKRFSDKCHSASTEKYVDNDIEYTRTDAFIEKAWDWVEDNILSSNQQDKSHLYREQFRKYMEE